MTASVAAATPPTPPLTAPAASWAEQRRNMVDSQVRPSDVVDRRILRAMGIVPREKFVPADLQAIAYMDNPVPLGRGPGARTLMEPRLFAKLVQLAEVPDSGRVLNIGDGCGYGAAVLAAMGFSVTVLESEATAAAATTAGLEASGTTSAIVRTGDLTRGAADDGPFDAILIAGSIAEAPRALLDQLKSGGRLVAVRGVGPGGKATAWIRSGTTYAMREAFDAAARPLPAFVGAATFAL
jgi:protein-L-isoaspartate(D-aspartate) O-methyltransferase